MIKAIIFDCFGVIYASRLDIFLQQYAKTTKQGQIMQYIHAYDRSVISKDELINGIELSCGASREEIESALFSGFTINLDVVRYINELKVSYKTALLTNIGPNNYKSLEPHLIPLFDVVVASFKVGIAKPDRAIYDLVARKLEVDSSECVFVDDQQIHCDGAVAAGMHAFLFVGLTELRAELASLLDLR